MILNDLGRTGLRVSLAGLGTGGKSRLGIAQGRSHHDAVEVVHRAIGLGVNFIDTAPAYGTESAVGRAIGSVPRHEVVVSTKISVRHARGGLTGPEDLRRSLRRSLRRLGTDVVDVLFLHGVSADDYPYCAEVLAPELVRLRDQGVTRAIGVTETFARDPRHTMLDLAIEDADWDVVMAGFNVLNPSARRLVARADARGMGVIVMHAVRWILASDERVLHLVSRVDEHGVAPGRRERLAVVARLLAHEGAHQFFPEAAYRFAARTTGVDSVLVGTGNLDHLEANIGALTNTWQDPSVLPLLEALDGLLEGAAEGSGDRP